jgi:hypothetical protein
MTQQDGMRALVDKALASVERAVMTKIEVEAIRVPAFEAFKQLIVSTRQGALGNAAVA